MGKQEMKGSTEPMQVVVVSGLEREISETALGRCGTPDVCTVIVVPQQQINIPGKPGDSLVATAACELDGKGNNPTHITTHGKGTVETTRTTAEQRGREADATRRIEGTPAEQPKNNGEER